MTIFGHETPLQVEIKFNYHPSDVTKKDSYTVVRNANVTIDGVQYPPRDVLIDVLGNVDFVVAKEEADTGGG